MQTLKLQITLFCLGTLACWSCTSHEKAKVTIASAANMQFAIADITKAFESKTGISTELTVSSSGKLTAQIKAGAPFDIFVSADMKYPMQLFEEGMAREKPKVYAAGKLVLWSLKEDVETDLAHIKPEHFQHLALANPKTAPYGRAAMETLEHYGLLTAFKGKLVFGESISQTNQFIISGAAEAGFTAKSVVLSKEMKGKGHWTEIDPAVYRKIEQGVLLLDSSQQEAKQFYRFLFSEQAREILKNYGYLVYE